MPSISLNRERRQQLDVPVVRRWPSVSLHLQPETLGRCSEKFARFMGTPAFLVQMTAFIILWLCWNWLAPPATRFDPYTFTFLTLLLSLQASYAAPLILLAQNRQDDRDRVAIGEDRRRAERSLHDTEFLTRETADLRMRMGELVTRSYLREQLAAEPDDRLAAVEAALGEVLLRLDSLAESPCDHELPESPPSFAKRRLPEQDG